MNNPLYGSLNMNSGINTGMGGIGGMNPNGGNMQSGSFRNVFGVLGKYIFEINFIK